jgi:RNA polymerase sigma factor (sigma-70 family)
MEGWAAELQSGRPDAAWDLFLDRYRRLIFAAIRHYAQDYDDVMDVFARVCEALREDDLQRLRTYAAQPDHRARFSTWLVTVVRHLSVDWFRHRDGRRRLSLVAEALPPLRRRIFEHVFLDQRSHIEAYELIHAREAPALSFKEFLGELRATYNAIADGRRGRVLGELGGTPPAEEEPAAASLGDIADTRALLEQAFGALSAEDRVAVELYIVEELPAADVARGSRFESNRLTGALVNGIRFTISLPLAMADNGFRSNLVSGAGSAGIFAQLACRNTFVGNNLQGNAGNIGAFFDGTTGANTLLGNNTVVIDNGGGFDCDGDGVGDRNMIAGPGLVGRGGRPGPPDTLSAVVTRRGIAVR